MRTATFAVLAALTTIGCSDPPASAPDGGSLPGVDFGTQLDDIGNDVGTATTELTYYADIKPILDGRCVSCHAAGAIGPFELDTYEAVEPLHQLIAQVVQDRTMPPFLPSPGCKDYVYDPNLSSEQIDNIVQWAAAGAPAGDPSANTEPDVLPLPPPPDLDTTLEMPEAYTPQLSPDDYRCFVIDWPYEEQKYVTGFGVQPGDPRIVHHIIAYHIAPENADEAASLDAADPGPGYSCFGGPNIGAANEQSWLAAWAPGGNGSRYPPGTGLPVEPGSKVVIQVHYNTLGTSPVPDKTKILFQTADTVDKPGFFHLWASPTWLQGGAMNIPAGDPAVSHRFSLDPTLTTGGRPMTLYSSNIHMHLLGREASTYVLRENGETECLLQINNYDFSWQGGAGFAEPVTINPGDKLVIECLWDNSMANQPIINGEQITPADRAWGEGTTDEMCLGIYYATID